MNQKTIAIILVAAVVILFGTIVYFATTNNADQPIRPDTKNTTNWRIYKNDTYGFELTFPDTWYGFTAAHRSLNWASSGTSDSIDFGLPTQKDGLFNISIHTRQQWNEIQGWSGPKPSFLGDNENYVFAWAQAQYAADSATEKRMSEVKNIIKTFRIRK